MDTPTSPVKRRVLGELNPNAASPKACCRTDLKLAGASPTKQQLPQSPIKMKLAPPTTEQQSTSPSRKSQQPQKQQMAAEESPKKRRSPSPAPQQAVAALSRQDAERVEVVEPPAKRPCLEQSAEGQQGSQESVEVSLPFKTPIDPQRTCRLTHVSHLVSVSPSLIHPLNHHRHRPVSCRLS